ncbi:MAG: DNA repair protein RecN [Lentisphaeria bacterium]|nr:DNA repair protein RecN [Lentisphaeria bacterium]
MLTYLKIKNFALIENAEIEFGDKFNVITGESGSGKSILLGALSLLNGERRESGVIRTNAERCEVCAILRVTDFQRERLGKIFEDNDLDISLESDEELIIRRVISANGSRNYVNDCNVSAKILQKISGLFFDFNRPDDELSLNSTCRQLELLDRFGAIDKTSCNRIYHELIECREEISNFEANTPQLAEIEEAKELISRFEAVNPLENEDEDLSVRHKLLANSQEIIASAAAVVNGLTDNENSLADYSANITRELYHLNKLAENSCDSFVNEIELIGENIRELSQKIEKFISSIDIDQEEFFNLENRLAEIHKLKKLYGPSLQEVFANYEIACRKVAEFVSSQAKKAELSATEFKLKEKLLAECRKLSQARRVKSEELTSLMIAELHKIGFTKANLKWEFKEGIPTENGFDEVEILFSANQGEQLQALRKIASSGERSRLFLAIKSVLAKVDDIPIVIFDEIDANIGGETANKVAGMLRDLSEYRQLILISHLAQVAAKATNHLYVYKEEKEGRTFSHVVKLSGEMQVNEIARLLGGKSDLAIARLHAKELLNF